MVLSHLIQACNHELRYSFSLHIVLSRKHASTWLDSVNTSPVHFTNREDSRDCIRADLFFWALDSFRSLLEFLLTITSGPLEIFLSPIATGSYVASSCRCPGTCRSLPARSFSFCATLNSCCRCSADSTVLETTHALSYVSKYSGKKITNPFNSKMEILKLFVPCHRTHVVI